MELIKAATEKELIAEIETFVVTVESVEIRDLNDCQGAVVFRNRIKTLTNQLEAARKELTVPLDDTKKKIMVRFKVPTDRLEALDLKIKNALLAFDAEQKRLAAIEQKRLDDLAAKAAQAERERLEKEAVVLVATTGDVSAAEEILKEAESVTAQVLELKAPSLAVFGVHTRDNWKVKVVDVSKLDRKYMIPDERALNELARSSKGNAKIHGVEFWNDKGVARR